jgi:hypothetical protein
MIAGIDEFDDVSVVCRVYLIRNVTGDQPE